MMRGGIIELEVALSVSEPLASVDVWLVLDLLRASTTMVSWFEAGGKEIYPEASVEKALSLKEKMASKGKKILLMGERNAVPPEGFDAGNSPLEITEELAKQTPTAIMATTNGTKALLKAIATGAVVYVACARNAFYAIDLALTHGTRIGILCAGRLGRPAIDDTLCAGLMAERICMATPSVVMSDGANIARELWKNWLGNFEAGVRGSDHARFLEKIGFGDDVRFACQQDVTACVPEVKEIADEYGEGLRAVVVHERAGGLRFFSPDVVSSIKITEAASVRDSIVAEENNGEIADDDIFLEESHEQTQKALNIDFGDEK